MRKLSRVSLLFFAFLFVIPFISITIQFALAQDTTKPKDTLLSDTVKEAEKLLPAKVYVLKIDGAIGAVTDERIEQAIELAEDEGAELLVVTLNTPGGFSNATRSICSNFLNSKVPVCVYVSPSGAHAGSAGVYMTYAAHIAAMAPTTNIGSAHPVGGSGEKIDSIMNEKVTNDAVAQIRAYAQKRGRNEEWAEKVVRESVSITDKDALEINVIDVIARDIDDLLEQLNGREIELTYGKKTLALENREIEEIETSFAHKILEIITQPNIAFMLMSIGGLGIMLELYNPGSIFPGVVGAISLILAFYAFQTLPINFAGLALVLLAALLFIAEIKIISHGLLTVGGVISLFFGGLMLIDTVDPALGISMPFLISMVIFVGAVVFLVTWLVIKAQKNRPIVGNEGLIGQTGEVRKSGYVYVGGALWKIDAAEEYETGSKVEITAVDGLKLKVRKLNS
ncbi:MAG: nodulation protein NfeD [candidate division Zixibacteria bacterium]|nr:nodulation protein NfeD [candidate division Zixibacteria bacterium]